MVLNEFQSIVNEYFDVVHDDATRKCIIALEDSEQSQLLSALASALYDKVVAKVDKIDFGSIPKSRGDITKVDGYENTVECLNIMRRLVVEYKQDTTVVDNVLQAIENVKANKVIFMKGFEKNVELPMVLYNLIVLSIEQSVSYLITVCIEYVKDSETKDIQIAIDRVAYNNVKENLIYQQVCAFNDTVNNKEFDEAMRAVLNKPGVREDAEVHDFTANNDVDLNAKKIVIKVIKADDDAEFKKEEEDHCDYEGSPWEEPEEDEAPEEPPMAPPEDAPVDEMPVTPPEDPMEEPKDVPDPKADIVHDEEDPEPEVQPEPQDGTGDTVVPYQEPVNGSAEINNESSVIGSMIVTAAPMLAELITPALIVAVLTSPIWVVKWLIPTLRNITYGLFNMKLKLADALETQGQFIEMNAYKLQMQNMSGDGISDADRAKIVAKQQKIANKLKSWGNKIAMDHKISAKKAEANMKDDNKKVKIEDIMDELPKDIYAKSVLF